MANLLEHHQQMDRSADQQDPLLINCEWKIEKVLRHEQTPHGQIMIKVCWKNGDVSWQSLNATRHPDPYALLTCALNNDLSNDPNWAWTKEHTDDLDLTTQIVQAHNATRKSAPKCMFGAEAPQSIKHAIQSDRDNGNRLWKEAIDKEPWQPNDCKTFHCLKSYRETPQGCSRIPYHFVFAVKVDGSRRKARPVAGGNRAPECDGEVHSGVVGMDAVRLTFLHASLNNPNACAADIGNTFLCAKCKEKLCVVAGDDFGSEFKGEPLILNKGLYGIHSASAGFHEHLSRKLPSMGHKPSHADFNLWIRDEGDCHSLMAACADDVLVSHKDPMSIINKLKKDHMLKGAGTPECHLGGNVADLQDTPWQKRNAPFALSADTCITNAADKLQKLTKSTFKTAKVPMQPDCHPELDETPFLDEKDALTFRTFVGSAQWAVALGRFDMHCATSTLSRHNTAPREGHMKRKTILDACTNSATASRS